MQQDQAGGSDHIKQNQDNRRVLKPPAAQGEIPHQPQQPQKCPRCESMNTKFCYYNNYSLSQPRYFCKTCRRYWTQGGTLRNVPVGGGCRKGKRAKTSNSTTSASSVDQVIKPSQSNFQTPQNSFSLTSSGPSSSTAASISPVVQTGMGTYFNNDAGGFLTSLATVHSINNQPPVSFTLNQPHSLGGDLGGTSNLGLLHGFNAISSFGSSQSRQLSSYFPFEENLLRPSSRAASANNNSQQQNWHQGFPSNANNSSIVSDTTLWSISTTTSAGNTNNNNTGFGTSSSLNPDHQWPDLPGYGNPP